MKHTLHTSEKKVVQIPFGNFFREGESQRDRILQEVMEALFSQLRNNIDRMHDFTLSNGIKCWVTPFYAPKIKKDSLTYGFDVKFEEEYPLSHLEFSVKCTGWERALHLQSKEQRPDA